MCAMHDFSLSNWQKIICIYLVQFEFLIIHFRLYILKGTHMGSLVVSCSLAFQCIDTYFWLYSQRDIEIAECLICCLWAPLLWNATLSFLTLEHSAQLSWEVTLPLYPGFKVCNCIDRRTRHRYAQEGTFYLLCSPWLCGRWENYLVIPAIRKFTILGHKGIWL